MAVALTCLLTAGAGASRRTAAARSLVSWGVSATPFRLSFAEPGGAPLVAEADTSGGPGGRLSYRLQDGSFHALKDLLSTTPKGAATEYSVATDEPARTAIVDVQPTATGASVTFALRPSSGVVATFEAFAAGAGEHFLGGGQRPGSLDLRGQAFAVKAAYACQNTMPAPFFLSSGGYGVALRSEAIASFGFPGSVSSSACPGGATPRCPLADGLAVVQLCSKSSTLAYDLFAGTPKQVVTEYVGTIGRPQLPPPSQLALIKWRDVVGGSGDLFDDVDRLHALHVPIGWVLLDNPWETANCYGEMTFDPQRFPNPQRMIRALHRRGVRFMLWISPLVRQQLCPPTQYPQSVLYGTGGSAVTIDLTDPATRATFEGSLRTLIGLGVDGFKADRGDEIDLEPERLAGGAGVDLHNEYPRFYAQSVAAAIRAAGRAGTFATLFRAAAPGSASLVPGFWGGDQEGTFVGLQQSIHEGLSAGTAGYAVWGSDTGGYGATASAEVFVRWAQFSALSPIFEVGGTGRSSTFWDYGTRTVNAFRRAVVLHYELFPYLYDLTRIAHGSGLPVLRPLALEYPGDANAWRQDLEVLVGRDLLAAPVISPAPAGAGGTVPAPVYLPAGSWIDLATGVSERGGRPPFPRSTPFAEEPLYLRAGAAIPFAARAPLVWPRPWPTNELQLPGRGGWLYAPADGSSFARSPEFGSFHAVGTRRTFDLTLRGAPRESQVLLATDETPRAVQIDGTRVPQLHSLRALQGARVGWAVTTAPFPGIVLKLAPRAGTARAEVVLP